VDNGEVCPGSQLLIPKELREYLDSINAKERRKVRGFYDRLSVYYEQVKRSKAVSVMVRSVEKGYAYIELRVGHIVDLLWVPICCLRNSSNYSF